MYSLAHFKKLKPQAVHSLVLRYSSYLPYYQPHILKINDKIIFVFKIFFVPLQSDFLSNLIINRPQATNITNIMNNYKILNCLSLLNTTKATVFSINIIFTGSETISLITFALPENLSFDSWDYSETYDDPDCTFHLLTGRNNKDIILASIIL